MLDAEGAEIRKGDTVWTIKDARELEVIGLYPEQDSCPVKVKEHKNGAYIFSGIDPDQLTHRAPVLAADGRPLREGETVYHVADGRAYSWERLEEDAGKNPFDYCKDVGHRLDTCENSEAYKARDLVRRCRALAERERGE